MRRGQFLNLPTCLKPSRHQYFPKQPETAHISPDLRLFCDQLKILSINITGVERRLSVVVVFSALGREQSFKCMLVGISVNVCLC